MKMWMEMWLLVAVGACVLSRDDTALSEGDASTGFSGSGGAPAEGCTPDRSRGDGGAVFESPSWPAPGAWCPEPGFEYCEPLEGSTAVFRCIESGRQRAEGETCTPENDAARNCTIGPLAI